MKLRLCLFVAPLLASALASQASPPRGSGSFRLALELPAQPQASLRLQIPLEGRAETLSLWRHSNRADDFQVLVWLADGTYVPVEAPPLSTYRGELSGRDDLLVSATWNAGGLRVRMLRDDHTGWELRQTETPVRNDGRLARGSNYDIFAVDTPAGEADCGTPGDVPAPIGTADVEVPRGGTPGGENPVGGPLTQAFLNPICLKRAEIAFDCDFEYYQGKGSSIAATTAAVETILDDVNLFYERDARITHVLTTLVIRTAPFYTPTSGGDLLNQFRDEWNTTLAGEPRDLTHLMTSKSGSLIEFGGLAFVGVICTSSAYGWSMDGANIVGHEVGHNWGAGHCHDPTPCNNMCGACFNIGPNTREIILAHRNSRACLVDAPASPSDLPPYGAPERAAWAKNDFVNLGTVTFDVLANDADGNCETVSIGGFAGSSPQGGTVALSVGTGPGGRDELSYTPPADVFVGNDAAAYDVADTSGNLTPTQIDIEVRPLTLAAYWPCDDDSGSVITDLSGNGNDGVAQLAPTWVAGQHGRGLRYLGDGQIIDTGVADFAPPWTYALWIKRRANPASSAAIAESSDGSLRLEQWFDTGRVGVTRYGTGDFATGYTSPNNVWVHLAFVGTDTDTTLYVNGAFEETLPVSIRAPTGPFGRAGDPLNAVIDEVRIYPYALSAAEVAGVFSDGGRADAPVPPDGGRRTSSDLTWLSPLSSASYDVYFGTSYAAVRDAGTGSPEFMGNQALPGFDPGTLLPATTYYWRVDSVLSGGTLGGDTWQFQPVELGHWPLDETSGTTAFDAEGSDDATLVNGPLLGQTGATPNLGTSLFLDGVNDYGYIPRLNLNSDRVTLSAWIRRSGAQASFAGILHSRAQNTVAGLNFGSADELRYHWNNAGNTWSWDSGLVPPDDTWVFVALVVEPDRATIYQGDLAGNLSKAVNLVSHGPEEFDGRTQIGRDATGGRQYAGWIDDVKIFDAALTPGQVDALYRASL